MTLARPSRATKKKVVFPLTLAHDGLPRMNYSIPYRQPSRRGAFTLIELLVVITIIAVLAGLLLPVGQKVLENTKKVSTKSTETQIISAVNSYQTEYGQYPVAPVANPTDVTFGLGDDTTHNNHALFDVLRAINTADATTGVLLNSRRIPYFESKNVKSASSTRAMVLSLQTPLEPPSEQFERYSRMSSLLTIGDLVDSLG